MYIDDLVDDNFWDLLGQIHLQLQNMSLKLNKDD